MCFRFVSDTGKAAIVLTLLLAVSLTHAQDPNAAGSPTATDESMSSYQAINASVDTILQQYEQLTGRVIIKDSNLTANAVPVTISVPQPVPKSELVRLIEASLLLNNFALIPSQEPNTVKVININAGKNPRSEGVKLFTGPESIPEGEQIISYYMPFKYISANEALTVFQTHILPRAYTSFVPINSAQALLITETTSVIRQLISLQELIDAPPAKVVSEFISLVRADAERVAETINKLMENQRKEQAGGGGNPQQPGPVQTSVGAEAGILTTQAQLVPDTRTNRILLVTRPANVDYYKTLIKQFDLAVTAAQPLEYRLRYISAGDVLSVLQDLLSEGQQGQVQTGAQGQTQQQQQTRGVNINQTRSGSTSGYSPVSGSAGSVGAGQDLLQEPNEQLAPQAVVIGKTRIISDPKDNKILVIGPPENLQRVRTILDRLDRRPQQVYLSTVIAQLTLNNDWALGVDWTQTFKKFSGHSGIASSNLNSEGILGSNGSPGASKLDPRQLLTPSTLPSLQGLTIYGTIGDAVSYFIRATDSYGKTKILGRPAIYTANNKRAVIASGQRVPVPGETLSNLTTGTTGGIINNSSSTAVAATVNYEDVELRLEVIPLINSSNEVTLKVAQIDDTLGNTVNISGNQVPEVNSQRLTTTVTVPSGATVVLGGLIKETISDTNNGIPYLDRIPYLGHLFKYSTKSKERDELIVFISPTVVNDNAQTYRASIKEERRTQISPDAYPLAHPSDYSGAPPQPVRKKGKW
ncbi:MAG TPA: secretin N-terminal domain-containing protein, partial [Terriglobales bacterium]|nr:secretin N-terminal domain-containing protein [Terriglobales bacterium]